LGSSPRSCEMPREIAWNRERLGNNLGTAFPSGYEPNVSSIARSVAPGERWLYLSAMRVVVSPNTSATTSFGCPSIVRCDAVESRRLWKRATVIPSCRRRENGCTECGTCPSPTAGALLPPPGGGGVPGAPSSILSGSPGLLRKACPRAYRVRTNLRPAWANGGRGRVQ